jgi:hypothetical protein
LSGVLTRIGSGALALAVIAALSACGSSDKEKNGGSSSSGGSTLAMTVAESGKTVKYTIPKGAKGGLTTVKLTNQGKAPHAAQLVLVNGNHTAQDVQKAFGPDSTDKSEWLRAEGGLGNVPPGATASATVSLEPGRYMVADTAADGPPTLTEFKVTSGPSGSLPTTDTTVTAAEAGKDKYRWDISGPIKSGESTVTFKSEGKDALHFIQAVKLVGNPSEKQVAKTIAEQGKSKGPKVIDEQTFYSTAILDGKKSEVAPLVLAKPGRWVFFCALTDRGEKKEHFKEGLLKIVTVK